MAGLEKNSHLEENYKLSIKGNNMFFAKVINIEDPLASNRIQVRVKGLDDKISDDNLPWCNPFSPIFYHMVPKVGELVKLFLFNDNEPQMRRWWLGPVISSVQTLNFESFTTALANNDLSTRTPSKPINTIPSAKGVYPELDDIAIQGRNNTDLIFRDKEILIRAGKFVFNDNLTQNTTNPSYSQLKLTSDGKTSYNNMVANKIYLITHTGVKVFDKIITDSTLNDIEKSANSAVYAEPLVQFLTYIKEFVTTHIHPPELPADTGVGKVPEIANFDLNEIIAKNIKIN